MNEILMGIYNGIGDLLALGFTYIGKPLIVLAIIGLIWPYIAGMVKFFLYAIPAVIVYMMFTSGEFRLGVMALIGAIAVFFVLRAIFRAMDESFGILVTKEEADRMFWDR